jgi:hypothetical protein
MVIFSVCELPHYWGIAMQHQPSPNTAHRQFQTALIYPTCHPSVCLSIFSAATYLTDTFSNLPIQNLLALPKPPAVSPNVQTPPVEKRQSSRIADSAYIDNRSDSWFRMHKGNYLILRRRSFNSQRCFCTLTDNHTKPLLSTRRGEPGGRKPVMARTTLSFEDGETASITGFEGVGFRKMFRRSGIQRHRRFHRQYDTCVHTAVYYLNDIDSFGVGSAATDL